MPAESWADLLANADDSGQSFSILDEGDYDVTVTKAEVEFSKAGNKMYALTLEVESGEYAKAKLWKRLVIGQSSVGLGMFFRQMDALGLDNKFFASNPSDEIITQQLVGKRASAKVIQKTYNEQLKNDVDFLNRPKGPAPVGGPSGPADAPPPAPRPSTDAPPVTATSPAPPAPTPSAGPSDPWAASTPPTMPGLGDDPF